MRQKMIVIGYDDQEFTPIPGHRQYVVNRNGSIVKRVMSDTRINKASLTQTLHYVKGKRSITIGGVEYPNAYWYVTLLTVDRVLKSGKLYDYPLYLPVGVHRLVGLAYVPNDDPQTKTWINHENGIKIDNTYTNLSWSTPAANIRHAIYTGLRSMPSGEDHWHTGGTASAASKKLMSQAKVGKNHPKFSGYYVIDGKEYASAMAAARHLSCDPRTIRRICRKTPTNTSYFKPVSI